MTNVGEDCIVEKVFMKTTQKKKRILLLSWELLPVYAGGLGVLARDVVDELKRQGYDVDVLLPRIPARTKVEDGFSIPRLYNKFFKENKPIKGLDYGIDLMDGKGRTPGVLWPTLFSNGRGGKKSGLNLYPNNLPKHARAYGYTCYEYIKQNHKNYSLIVGFDWMTTPAFHLIKELNLPIPFYFHINSIEQDRTPDPRKLTTGCHYNKKLESKYFKEADHVIAISSVTKNGLIEHCGVPESKITIVSNDISFKPETKGYRELDKGKNILFIGRITDQKGIPFLLDTAEKVVSIDSQIRFLIAGDGNGMHQTVETIAERGLEKNCIMIGWVGNDQKKQLYKSADLFVMTSPSEPFGLTPLEAVMSDVPVISSQKCGFLDVIPSTPTYEYYDTNRFAELVLHYINDKEDHGRLLAKQKEEYSNHSWSDQIAKITTILSES